MALGKVIVYGATGEIGLHLARGLARYGHDTVAVVRAETQQSKAGQVAGLKAAGVKLVEGSLEANEEDLVKQLQGFDVVVSAISGAPSSRYQRAVSALECARIGAETLVAVQLKVYRYRWPDSFCVLLQLPQTT